MIVEIFDAMGTTVELHATDEGAMEAAREVFERAEQRFTRFRSTSELSRINRMGDRGVAVSEDMRDVLTTADELRTRTGGLVDVSVGAAVHNWGYATTFEDVTNMSELPEPRSATGWHLDGRIARVVGGARLDLGGIAKGWTCDRVVEAGHVTVASAGGDIRSADPTLVVEILDDTDAVATEIHVGVGALATSSRAKRRWLVGEEEAHHIIDPRTLRPAVTPVVSASVVAETAAEAEAGAKAVLIRGADGLRWADTQSWIRQAIVLWHDDNVYSTTQRQAS